MNDKIRKLLESENEEDQDLALEMIEDLPLTERKEYLRKFLNEYPHIFDEHAKYAIEAWLNMEGTSETKEIFEFLLINKKINQWISKNP